jgi:hypothetical protein
MFVGTVITGGSVSFAAPRLILTVKLPLAELPAASVAVQFTVVTPAGKNEPEGGVQTMVGVEQLSVAIT